MDKNKEYLENLFKLRNEIESELEKNLSYGIKAGAGQTGPYDIRVEHLEERLQNIDSKIYALRKSNGVTLWIMTGTEDWVKNCLPETLFIVKSPNSHHERDVWKWHPFNDGSYNISDTLTRLKVEKCLSFEYDFLPVDRINTDTYEKYLTQPLDKTIVIVDLLSINREGEFFLSHLDSKEFYLMLAPICNVAHEKIQEYMIRKLNDIIKLQKKYTFLPDTGDPNHDLEFYASEKTQSDIFIDFLERKIKKKHINVNRLKDTDSISDHLNSPGL